MPGLRSELLFGFWPTIHHDTLLLDHRCVFFLVYYGAGLCDWRYYFLWWNVDVALSTICFILNQILSKSPWEIIYKKIIQALQKHLVPALTCFPGEMGWNWAWRWEPSPSSSDAAAVPAPVPAPASAPATATALAALPAVVRPAFW